jgi:hypothetical protein
MGQARARISLLESSLVTKDKEVDGLQRLLDGARAGEGGSVVCAPECLLLSAVLCLLLSAVKKKKKNCRRAPRQPVSSPAHRCRSSR